MEINVEPKVLILVGILSHGFLESPNSWMIFLLRIHIESIQVLAKGIESIIATGYTVGVEGWNHFEHIVLPEKAPLLASEICNEIDCAIKHM